MKPRYAPFYALILIVLTGCSSLGLAPAKSLSDRLAYGYSTYTAVQYAAANATNAGELSKSDAETGLQLADQSRVLLDGARALLASAALHLVAR